METIELISLEEVHARASVPDKQDHPTTRELAKVDILPVALARFGDWRPTAEALVKKYKDVVFAVSTKKGFDEACAARAEVRQPRYAAQNVSKASKSELAKISKAIGAEEQAVITMLAVTEKAIDDQITAREEQLEVERLERERIEAERIERHQSGIARIRGYCSQAATAGKTSEQLARGIEFVEGLVFGEDWEEFASQAAGAQGETVVTLRTLYVAVRAREDEAIAAEARRVDQARIAEEQRIEAKRLADERAEFARQKAEFDARQKAEADRQFEARRQEELRLQPIAIAREAEPEAVTVETCSEEAKALLPGTPGTYASTEAKAADVPGSGDEGTAAHAEERAAEPVSEPVNEIVSAMSTGDVGKKLGFAITAAFLASLDLKPVQTSAKTGVFWRVSDWPAIKAAIIKHVQALA